MPINAPNHATIIATVRQALHHGQQPAVTVTSSSMKPLLQPADQVQLTAVTVNELRPGDILTVDEGDNLLTHRLWAVKDGRLYLRGDALLHLDAPFAVEALVGRVTARIRNDDTMPITAAPRLLSHTAVLQSRLYARLHDRPLPARVIHAVGRIVARFLGLFT